MKRIELAEYTIAGDEEAFLVKVYNGEQGDIVETIEARLIAFTNDSASLADNQASTLRTAAALLVELANQIHPASAGN